MNKKILICGLPGAGKTTIARALVHKLKAVWFNADDVRNNLSRDLGYTMTDRLEQASRMAWMCERVSLAGHWAVADFVCPTEATRQIFGAGFVVWVDTIKLSRYDDTNKLFCPPKVYNLRITEWRSGDYWSDEICRLLQVD